MILVAFISKCESRSFELTKNIRGDSKQSYQPKNGDLVLLQYRGANMQKYPRGFKDVPTHAGIIWIRNNIVYVIEATRFAGIYPIVDRQWNRNQGNGVRIVLLGDLLSNVDVYLSIRPIIQGSIVSFASELDWMHTLEFEPRISPNMHICTVLAMGLLPHNKYLARIFGYFTGLSSSKRKEVFCSEFISKLLQRMGHLDEHFTKHWTMTPIHFSSSLKTIDALSSKSSKPLLWGNEIGFLK